MNTRDETRPGAPGERSHERARRDLPPEFLADAAKRHFDINPVSGDEMQKIVEDIVATPKPIADRLQSIIGEEGEKK